MLYAMYHAKQVKLHSECVYHYRMVASGAMSKTRPVQERVQNSLLFQKSYAEFVDEYFTGEENRLMKQGDAIQQLIVLARTYNAVGFHRKEIIHCMRGHLREEPFKTAVKEFPLALLPKRRRWQLALLRIGLSALWVDLFRVTDKLWMKRMSGQGHKKYS